MSQQYVERLTTYLKERFHPVQMGLIALMLGLSSAYVAGRVQLLAPTLLDLALPTIALLLFLFRLRLLDEIKDAAHDKVFHPDRPIPRGLVRLEELYPFLFGTLFIEFIIAMKSPASRLLFAVSFGYSLLMFKEFFIRDWLRKHFTAYIISHEVLLIPLQLYLFTLTGVALTDLNNPNLLLQLVANFTALFGLEVVRKIRAPKEEFGGHDSYTSQYGISGATDLLGAVVAVNALVSGVLIKEPLILLPQAVFWLLQIAAIMHFRNEPTAASRKVLFAHTIIYTFTSQLLLILYWVTHFYVAGF